MRISLYRAVACRLWPSGGFRVRNASTLVESENDDLSLVPIPPPKSVLAPLDEDISHIDVNARPVFNFAYLINKSETLQNLLKLNVNLHRIEKNPKYAQALAELDFERDIKKHLFFLNDYVEADQLGKFITKNPLILTEDLDHMQTRINYLQSKQFTNDMLKRMITRNPLLLMTKAIKIDERLGHFQNEFHLIGDEVRLLATRESRLITYNLHHIKMNTFTLKEEMGFEEEQLKKILLTRPKILMINHSKIIKAFNYVHIKMNISHETLVESPRILTVREKRTKERNGFLKMLGRDQYDPTKPNYVPLDKLISGDDLEFCINVAKCNVDEYNLYLKSL